MERLFAIAQRDAKTKSGPNQLTGPYLITATASGDKVVYEPAVEAIAVYKEYMGRKVT